MVLFACSSTVFPPPTHFSTHSNLASSPEALPLTLELLDVMAVSPLPTTWFPWLPRLRVPFACLNCSFRVLTPPRVFILNHSGDKSLLPTGLLLRSPWENIKAHCTYGHVPGGLFWRNACPWEGGTVSCLAAYREPREPLSVHAFSVLASTRGGNPGNRELSKPLNS